MNHYSQYRIILLQALALSCVVGGVSMFLWLGDSGDEAISQLTAERLSSMVASGEANRLERAMGVIEEDWPEHSEVVYGLFGDEDWRLRVVACQLLPRGAGRVGLTAVLARALDIDWRVRACAYETLGRLTGVSLAVPLRDTPMSEREEMLLAWLGRVGDEFGGGVEGELCEVFADAAYLEFGKPMVDRCLECHVGSLRGSAEEVGSCVDCHSEIVREYAGSSHRQSLTHLQLRTVDSQTREPGYYDFGSLRGIDCVNFIFLD